MNKGALSDSQGAGSREQGAKQERQQAGEPGGPAAYGGGVGGGGGGALQARQRGHLDAERDRDPAAVSGSVARIPLGEAQPGVERGWNALPVFHPGGRSPCTEKPHPGPGSP